MDRLADSCSILLSICPPHAALETVRQFRGYSGLYADLNAVSPATAVDVGGHVARFVDGGIVGPPPSRAGTTRVYLAGEEAGVVAALFEGTALQAQVLGARPGDASALKMMYAAWTKGTAAMLLAIRAAAREFGVDEALVDEWEISQPELPGRSETAAQSALANGWRWAFELEEIGRTFAAAGLPDGFGAAAAEVFGRVGCGGEGLDEAISRLQD
ncbi:DUF1932 domain-containing protein [Kibdelosporangium philippinense]|uniref:DUF1932 domain-containing protein n=1 Tax=Kibdelosporangium philippinense TaxID=211113 RepID=A0ABS8ZTB4_9PSEU|nr:DUF1932 domain-containing protein [Kibdelosporangium philippinense]MCE7010969.1 DUF1932 domain-containing protein [Kibdelosporangium philippinense]